MSLTLHSAKPVLNPIRSKGMHTFGLPDGSSGGALVPLCFVILLVFPCTPTLNLSGVTRGLLLRLSKKWKRFEESVRIQNEEKNKLKNLGRKFYPPGARNGRTCTES